MALRGSGSLREAPAVEVFEHMIDLRRPVSRKYFSALAALLFRSGVHVESL